MATKGTGASGDEQRLSSLRCKKQAMFAKVTQLHDLVKRVTLVDRVSRSNEEFLDATRLVNTVPDRYESLANDVDALARSSESKYVSNFDDVFDVEEMCSRILSTRERLQELAKVTPVPLPTATPVATIHLPPIDLVTFDGRPENWPLFYETFRVNIHENPALQNAQRVRYLVGKLSGDAKRIFAGVTPSGETYSLIWDALVARYQNPRALAEQYHNQVLELKTPAHSHTGILQFVDRFAASSAALRQLPVPDLADFLLLHAALRRVDSVTLQNFELAMRGTQFPVCADFISFLHDQARILQSCTSTRSTTAGSPSPAPRISKTFLVAEAPQTKCVCCHSRSHVRLLQCRHFKRNLPVNERFALVRKLKACFRCLELGHRTDTCRDDEKCSVCGRGHHTLLHFSTSGSAPRVRPASSNAIASSRSLQSSAADVLALPAPGSPEAPADPVNLCVLGTKVSKTSSSLGPKSPMSSTVLLSTAQVIVKAPAGTRSVIVRCLLDNGSQHHLITRQCCRDLNLPVSPLSNSSVKGLGSISRPIHGYVHLEIGSRVLVEKRFHLRALVVDSITDALPSCLVQDVDVSHLEGVQLADLSWNIPGPVEMVIGAQLFPYLLLGGKIVHPRGGSPVALETELGYVLSGDVSISCSPVSSESSFTGVSLAELDANLHRFWELEEVPSGPIFSQDETDCENFYTATVRRGISGRYVVHLPFLRDSSELGDSKSMALKRFSALERKFSRLPALRDAYRAEIEQYVSQGYVAPVLASDHPEEGYYIPHHAIVRPDKPTPRIVLDASASTSSGFSLNDLLHVGPNLQADLFSLLVNFRVFAVALTADVRQMYLQIEVTPLQQKFLKFIFRDDPSEEIRVWQFTRLPFGLKSSPYLAMRTIRHLCGEMQQKFPEASEVAASYLYMDDLVYSCPALPSAEKLAGELIELFQAGCFQLVKWSSNRVGLLEGLPESHRRVKSFAEDDVSAKVLGMSWDPSEDFFTFIISSLPTGCSKRIILSVVARLFDVLGLVAPVVLYAKLIIKELWQCGVGWDDPPPADIVTRFRAFAQELPLLESLKIPRHVGITLTAEVSLVAFCDASTCGYGTVVYAHCVDVHGQVSVNLICAKSKVTPTKITTLARLELCAAVLMAKLVSHIRTLIVKRVPIRRTVAFSDSTVTLSWIKSPSHRWSVFVGNRVAKCQGYLDPGDFHHVAGRENPSDCLSRGLLPAKLVHHDLWWKGPSWMSKPVCDWPIQKFAISDPGSLPELRTKTFVSSVVVQDLPVLQRLVRSFSSWEKLLRVCRYLLRFVQLKCPRLRMLPSSLFQSTLEGTAGLIAAERVIVRAVQSECFAADIKAMRRGAVPGSRLQALSAFLDEFDVLRVGGRLRHSDLPYEAKFPVILPKKHALTSMLIDHFHRVNCHTGPALLMSLIRQRFWILDARSVIRARVRSCNSCFRVRPRQIFPRMADLPQCRLQEAKAFVHTGVDYAGPLSITLCRRRGQRTQKAYVCLFVCLVTKAVHIELATELSTQAFLSAFKRFISRRGPVSCIYSDNGTNFIGARAQLDETHQLLLSSEYVQQFKSETEGRRIKWLMIPPRAPHFGALWESNIKSLKTHLFRVIGKQILTYEEMLTVLAQIESLLNSRPLVLVSSDPSPEVLSPAHFLMSTPLQYLPAPHYDDHPRNLADRKKLLDCLVQSYWKRWRNEYLHTLQSRGKWRDNPDSVKVGQVVIIDVDNTPPLQWPLGVISEVFPGPDGVVRVATVKTDGKLFRRPVVKLYPLPSQ